MTKPKPLPKTLQILEELMKELSSQSTKVMSKPRRSTDQEENLEVKIQGIHTEENESQSEQMKPPESLEDRQFSQKASALDALLPVITLSLHTMTDHLFSLNNALENTVSIDILSVVVSQLLDKLSTDIEEKVRDQVEGLVAGKVQRVVRKVVKQGEERAVRMMGRLEERSFQNNFSKLFRDGSQEQEAKKSRSKGPREKSEEKSKHHQTLKRRVKKSQKSSSQGKRTQEKTLKESKPVHKELNNLLDINPEANSKDEKEPKIRSENLSSDLKETEEQNQKQEQRLSLVEEVFGYCQQKDWILKESLSKVERRLDLLEEVENYWKPEIHRLDSLEADFKEIRNLQEDILSERQRQLVEGLEERLNGFEKSFDQGMSLLREELGRLDQATVSGEDRLARLEKEVARREPPREVISRGTETAGAMVQRLIKNSVCQAGEQTKELSLENDGNDFEKIKTSLEDSPCILEISRKVDVLTEDQEALCKETANLLTNICMKERENDKVIEEMADRLDGLQSMLEAKPKDSSASEAQTPGTQADSVFALSSDLSLSYSQLKSFIDSKVETYEVQMALDSMQKKLMLLVSREMGMVEGRLARMEERVGESGLIEEGRAYRGKGGKRRAGGAEEALRRARGDKTQPGYAPWEVGDDSGEVSRNSYEEDQTERSFTSNKNRHLLDQIIAIKDEMKTKVNVKDFDSYLSANQYLLEDIGTKLENKVEESQLLEQLAKKVEIEQMEELTEAVEEEIKKIDSREEKLHQEAVDRFQNVEQMVNILSAMKRIAIWKWESGDITEEGDIVPGVLVASTLDKLCVWKENSSLIRINTSGLYRLTIFVRFLTKDRPNLSIILDDEIYQELSYDSIGEIGCIDISKHMSLDSARTLSLAFDRHTYSSGLLEITKL